MAKPNFILPNKPAIKAGSILSYNYTDDLKFAAEPLDFSRNGSATRVNKQGLIETTSANLPRIDYSDSSTEPSLLLEPQSTNLITYSEDFSQWAKVGTPTITSNYSISPDGTQNSTRVEFDANERIYFILSASGDITFSVYLKGSGVITLRDNTNGYRQDVTLTSEWARYDLSFNATITSLQIQNQTASIVDCEIWGAMLEENSYPTSLIPTSGSTATRLGETANNAGGAGVFNSEEGVLYAEINPLTPILDQRISLSDGGNNKIVFSFINSNQVRMLVFNGSVQAERYQNITYKTINKLAISYKLNEFKFTVNGVIVSTVLNGNTPTNMNKLNLSNNVGLSPFYGKTKNVKVFNYALTDEELQTLTT